jgi:hypothetical protein
LPTLRPWQMKHGGITALPFVGINANWTGRTTYIEGQMSIEK